MLIDLLKKADYYYDKYQYFKKDIYTKNSEIAEKKIRRNYKFYQQWEEAENQLDSYLNNI